MSKAEWSGWAQAILSALAIYVAILTAANAAQRENKREAQVRIAQAFVVRTSILMTINIAEGVFKRMLSRWERALANDAVMQDGERDLERLASVELPADEQLLLLANSHPSGAQALVMARTQASHLQTLLRQYVRYQKEESVLKEDLQDMLTQVKEVVDYLSQGINEISDRASPKDEFHGDVST